MARRSDHTKDELKELIFNTSRDIVIKEGFRELSARKIATEIGYTVGTLYNFYTNLDDLILQINGKTLDSLYESLIKETSNINNQNIRIHKLGKGYVDFSSKNYNLWNMLYEYHFPRPKGTKLPNWYEEKIDKIFKLVEEVLLPFVRGNKVQAGKVGKMFWASLHGICVLSITGKLDTAGADSANVLAESFIKVFTSGIKSLATH